MQVKELENKDLKRAFEVTIQAEEVEKALNERLKELSKTVKMPGFRPGKIPMNVMKQRHKDSVMGEVLEKIIGKTSQDLVAEKKIRPALQPKIEVKSFEDGSDLIYTTSLEIFPEVPEMKWDEIKLEEWTTDIAEEEINDALEKVKSYNKDFQPIAKKRKTVSGDTIIIDFEGSINGEVFDGGKAEDFRLELGSNSLIPGFEDQLIGQNAGDDVLVKVDFPKEYHSKELAGKPSEFKVHIKEIQEAVEPELNDEYAKKIGFDSLDKLKESIKEQLSNEYEQLSLSKMKKELFDHLDEQYHFMIPEGMVKMEFDALWEKVKPGNDNQQPEEYKDKSEEELKEEMQKMAERRVRLGIILAETGRKEKVEISQQELQQALIQKAREFPGQEQMVIDFYKKNPNAVEEFRGPILEDKVVNIVLERVKKETKKVNGKELKDYFENQN